MLIGHCCSLWQRFNMVLENFLRDFVPYWHDSIMHIHDVNLQFQHISKLLYWIEICWLWRPFEFSELIVMFKRPVWDDLNFVTWHVILLEVAIRRWWTWWSATILKQAVTFKQFSIGTKDPKVCKENILHTITPPAAWTVDTRQDGSIQFWPSHLNVAAEIEGSGNVFFPIFICPILVSQFEWLPQFPVLSWQECLLLL